MYSKLLCIINDEKLYRSGFERLRSREIKEVGLKIRLFLYQSCISETWWVYLTQNYVTFTYNSIEFDNDNTYSRTIQLKILLIAVVVVWIVGIWTELFPGHNKDPVGPKVSKSFDVILYMPCSQIKNFRRLILGLAVHLIIHLWMIVFKGQISIGYGPEGRNNTHVSQPPVDTKFPRPPPAPLKIQLD